METRSTFIEENAIALSYEKLTIDEQSLEERLVVDDLYIVSTERDKYCSMKLVFRSAKDDILFRKKISLGDEVLIQENGDTVDLNSCKEAHTELGIVAEITAHTISFLVHRNCKLNLNGEKYIFEKQPDGLSFDKLAYSLSCLKTPSSSESDYNLDRIFFEETPIPAVKRPVEVEFFNNDLDDSQKYAVRFALAQEKLCLVHGPPGTGKTALIIEILHQLKREGKKAMVCAPSNVALDNILERMEREGFTDMVRLGNSFRANPKLQKYCADVKYQEEFHTSLFQARSVIKERLKPKFPSEKSVDDVADILSSLRMDQPKLEPIPFVTKKIVNTKTPYSERLRFILDCQFVLGTLIGLSSNGMILHLTQGSDRGFDVIIIDECSQCSEIATWLSIPLAKKAILVGDTKQLPPFTFSKEPQVRVLQFSLMDRLLMMQKFADYQVFLTIQHRMNSKIIEWCSRTFYKSRITSDPKISEISLDDISGSIDYSPLILFDSKNCQMGDSSSEDVLSCCNILEAQFVAEYAKFLINNGIDEGSIGIITPYKQQVKIIRSHLEKFTDIAIKTVDGFQGQERDAILLSLVRSNPEQRIGFLSDLRRMNVALTRCRRHLAVFCDSSTISSDETLTTLVEYMYEHAGIIPLEDFYSGLKILSKFFKK